MKLSYLNYGPGREYIDIEDGNYSGSILLHRDRTSDADSLRRSAAEARAKAARELKRAERMERAAEQLTKGE